MLNFLKENWFRVSIFVIFLLAGLVVSYWNGLRPYFGKKECYERAEKQRQYAITGDETVLNQGMSINRANYERVFQDSYDICLMQKGLGK